MDFAAQVGTKIAEEIGKLARGQKKITVRQLVKRFGFARRTASSVGVITAALESAGVACHPSFEEAPGLDDTLVLTLSAGATAPVTVAASPVQTLKAAAPASNPRVAAPVSTSPAPKPQLSTQQIIEYAQRATVLICLPDGHGSGFVLERAGLIATARHVVGMAREVEVFFSDGQKVSGQVLFSNATLDFAFVRVPPCPIAFKMRGEVEPYPGQRVFAIGSPRDKRLAGTVTAGIISNLSRVEGGVEYLQTDTPISPGNSGGPLIGEDGSVVGMNVWGRTDGPGLNFALPASYLAGALEWLRPQLSEIENRVYCASCGFLNAPNAGSNAKPGFVAATAALCWPNSKPKETMRLKTPRPTQSASFEQQVAAPRDVQSRAKALMKGLMRSKGLDADEIWIPELEGWAIPAPVPVLVRLVRIEAPREDGPTETLDFIDTQARLMRLPASQLLALYRTVLEANWQLTNTSFAIAGEHLYLTSRRPLADLDESELDSMIGHTISATRIYLPTLLEEFSLGAVPI